MISLRKNGFSVLAFLISLSMFGCAVSPLPAEKGPFSTISTEVIHYVPRDAPRNERSGVCWTYSIAAPRDHAWRCMAGNEIFDPCFAYGHDVVCGANPAEAKPGFRLVLTEPLPPSPAVSADPGTGWLIQMADGRICNRATGARGMVDGQMTTYYCTSKSPGDSAAVLGELKTGTIWTADIAVTDRSTGKIKERKTVPVLKVWQ